MHPLDDITVVTGLGDASTFGAYGEASDKVDFLNHYFPGAPDNPVNAAMVEHVEAALPLTPGIESPTVSPLHDKGWVAVRAMVERRETNRIMDALYGIGARAILVTSIHACRI